MTEKILRKLNLDALGIGASLLCAIHCVVLPFLMTILPLLGWQLLENEAVEYCLMAATLLIGCFSLYRGYRHQHRSIKPLLLFIAGFVLLLTGHFIVAGRSSLCIIAVGALSIIIAHWWNLRECRHCKPVTGHAV